MSLPRFFLEEQILSDEKDAVFELKLSAEDLHHANVLRLREGEHIAVIDADADYFECEIKAIHRDAMRVSIASHLLEEDLSHFMHEVVLFQGLPKNDKFDKIVKHGTEIGVSGFVPLSCKRSVVRLDARRSESKRKRWEAIAKNAAQQSGQSRIPFIGEVKTIDTALDDLLGFDAVLIFYEEAPSMDREMSAISKALARIEDDIRANVAIVIGPEGGFERSEIERLLDSLVQSSLVSLGSSILRTVTAAIVASALVIYELGGLGHDG